LIESKSMVSGTIISEEEDKEDEDDDVRHIVRAVSSKLSLSHNMEEYTPQQSSSSNNASSSRRNLHHNNQGSGNFNDKYRDSDKYRDVGGGQLPSSQPQSSNSSKLQPVFSSSGEDIELHATRGKWFSQRRLGDGGSGTFDENETKLQPHRNHANHVTQHHHHHHHHQQQEEDEDVCQEDEDGIVSSIRPPWRWILIGPPRSGTGLHIDPLWTNAWVTVLQGQKRWMLFPPCTPHEKVGMLPNQPQIPSSVWFRDYYDLVTSNRWPQEWKPVEVLQNPGETVFVPNGWMHLVLNLQLTVAVTHNYASEYGPFERMWQQVVMDEPVFAKRWYRSMRASGRQDLAERAKNWHDLHQQEEWTKMLFLDDWMMDESSADENENLACTNG